MPPAYPVLALCLLLFSSGAHAADWTGNINVSYGTAVLGNDFTPAYLLNESGFETSARPRWLPFHVLYGYNSGEGSGSRVWVYSTGNRTRFDMRHEVTEHRVGIRKVWDLRYSLHPFVGSGLTFITMKEFITARTSNNLTPDHHVSRYAADYRATGVWFGIGVFSTAMNWLQYGLEAQVSTAGIDDYYKYLERNTVGSNLGGAHLRAFVGVHY
jgi:hypothetical protein